MTNLLAQLQAVNPPPALFVALVATIHGDGTSTVTLPGGGSARVRGTQVSVGTPAFVRGGLIEGAAPALTPITIDI